MTALTKRMRGDGSCSPSVRPRLRRASCSAPHPGGGGGGGAKHGGMLRRRRPHVVVLPGFLFLLVITTLSASNAYADSSAAAAHDDPPPRCDVLPAKLTYRQEEAPRDLSGLLPVVVERVNMVLEGVVDVEVEWEGGDLHGRVGEHVVQCRVTRLASAVSGVSEGGGDRPAATTTSVVDESGRKVTTQCFHVPFTILDTNECLLPRGHALRHQCHESALCVNTVGSYECLCPRIVVDGNGTDPTGTVAEGIGDDKDDDGAFWTQIEAQQRSKWEVSFNTTSRSSCPSRASTHNCCPDRAHTAEGANCRAQFRCPVDPCATSLSSSSVPESAVCNQCARKATCVRRSDPLEAPTNYLCECPAGLLGNGRLCGPNDPKPQPKVMYDGITPTEETIKNDYYCDCTRPIVDACSGFPPCKGKHEVCTVTTGNIPRCACKPGYVTHPTYGCVDENPPQLRLRNDPRGDQTLRLRQGDVYHEYAVDIQDENAEEYLRSLKFTYSQSLPQGCLTKVGEFHVNYTVATPWTSPPYVRLTRRVIIEDVDECALSVETLRDTCPELIPKCDVEAGAACVNTPGSYTCRCPNYTSGDGFLSGLSFDAGNEPDGYKGGTGCVDTSKPVITLKGPNPKVFRMCECGGLSGIMGGRRKNTDTDLKALQQGQYDDDMKELIRSTYGAELCATPSNPSPAASDCAYAYDDTYLGRTDLSREVVVGEPVKKSPLHWSVPYNVQDKAGNAAVTVWRDVQIEEVALDELESKVRDEMLAERREAIDRAVAIALEQDRQERNKAQPAKVVDAPTCPKCDCPNSGSDFDPSMCDEICKTRHGTCIMMEESPVIRIWLWLETIVPPQLLPPLLAFVVLVGLAVAVQFLWAVLFRTTSSRTSWYANEERDRAMQNAVTFYRESNDGGAHSVFLPPKSSMAVGGGGAGGAEASATSAGEGLFSPRSSRTPFSPPGSNGVGPPRNQDDPGSIYSSPPIISPSARGDGVRRQSPFYPR